MMRGGALTVEWAWYSVESIRPPPLSHWYSEMEECMRYTCRKFWLGCSGVQNTTWEECLWITAMVYAVQMYHMYVGVMAAASNASPVYYMI